MDVFVVEPDHQLGTFGKSAGPAVVVRTEPDVVGHVVLVTRCPAHAEVPTAGHRRKRADRHGKHAGWTAVSEGTTVKHVGVGRHGVAAGGRALGHSESGVRLVDLHALSAGTEILVPVVRLHGVGTDIHIRIVLTGGDRDRGRPTTRLGRQGHIRRATCFGRNGTVRAIV